MTLQTGKNWWLYFYKKIYFQWEVMNISLSLGYTFRLCLSRGITRFQAWGTCIKFIEFIGKEADIILHNLMQQSSILYFHQHNKQIFDYKHLFFFFHKFSIFVFPFIFFKIDLLLPSLNVLVSHQGILFEFKFRLRISAHKDIDLSTKSVYCGKISNQQVKIEEYA